MAEVSELLSSLADVISIAQAASTVRYGILILVDVLQDNSMKA